MKKIISVIIVAAFGLFLFSGANVLGEKSKSATTYQVNKYSAQNGAVSYTDYYAVDGNIKSIAEKYKNSLYEVGKEIAISKKEFDQYVNYYKQTGSENPEKDAKTYAEQRNALYVEAMNNGFTVTEKEIHQYLDDLKNQLTSISNSSEYENIIRAYGSEKAYWNFEYEVYKINLPIQKYNSYMERKFKRSLNEEEKDRSDELWSEQFEKMKENAVKKQHFIKEAQFLAENNL